MSDQIRLWSQKHFHGTYVHMVNQLNYKICIVWSSYMNKKYFAVTFYAINTFPIIHIILAESTLIAVSIPSLWFCNRIFSKTMGDQFKSMSCGHMWFYINTHSESKEVWSNDLMIMMEWRQSYGTIAGWSFRGCECYMYT